MVIIDRGNAQEEWKVQTLCRLQKTKCNYKEKFISIFITDEVLNIVIGHDASFTILFVFFLTKLVVYYYLFNFIIYISFIYKTQLRISKLKNEAKHIERAQINT